ncbi:protein MMS22-like isoform X2 [Rhodnius prolixus]|uniref:protein MMS22-like isoform X2 n=1 Tax=Rhodnius prolixus TaxID=13249 RepID=UPI003D18AB99
MKLYLVSSLHEEGNYEFKNSVLFNCRGEVNIKQMHFPSDSYLKYYEGAQLEDITLKPLSSMNRCCDTYLFGKRWDYGSVLYKHLDILFKMASQELMQIEEGAKLHNSLGTNAERVSNKLINYKNSRFYCVELYLFIEKFVKCLCSSPDFVWMLQHMCPLIIKKMNTLQRQLKRFTDLPDYVYLHGCNSLGNKIAQPSYHLLHVYLDLRWLNITLLFSLSKAKELVKFNSDSTLSQHSFDLSAVYKSIQQLIFELFDIIVKRYEKIEINSLYKKSPFVCTCVQELWALLQILSDTLCKNNSGKKFWDFLSDYINEMNGFQNNSFLENDNDAVYSNLSCTSRITCSLWALCSIANLYKLAGYDVISCYPLLEDLLKAIGTEDMTESLMRTCLTFIEKICIDIWEPKVEPLVLLWEYFQKKLNNSFYIPGTTPDSLAVVSKNARGLLNQIKSFLQDINFVRDSFQHFLRILGLHLEKTKDSPKNWRLIKARIFTKLSPANVATLSQIGEYHFVSIFLTLALTLGYTQVGNKMIELGNLSKNSRGSMNIELVKGQLAFIIIIFENNGDAENLIKPIVEHVNTLSGIEHIDKLRLFAEAVQDILQSHDCLAVGQHLLIDVWMVNYLSCCSTMEGTKLLISLLRIIKRHKELIVFQKPEPQFLLFINKLWAQLEPYLSAMLLASSHSTIPTEALELAAALAMLYHNLACQETFKNILSLFLCREVAEISLIRNFLFQFIEYFGMNNLTPYYNKMIIKAWIRCCFFCACKESPEMRQLTTFILTVPEIKNLFDGYEENLSSLEEPLLILFVCLQNKYTSLEDIYKKQAIREQLLSYIEGLEIWVKPVISNPRNVIQVNRLYSTVGNMFRLVAPLLYVKSKPSTLLQQLVDQLLLPFAVHNPDTKVHENIIVAIKSYLHLFIQGLMQLCPEEDHYILRILKELITIYVPKCLYSSRNSTFSQTTFSLIREFQNFDFKLKTFILKTVCNIFLKRRTRIPSDQAIFGLIFVREIMNLHGKCENVFSCLVTCTFDRLCDVIMYCDENASVHRSAKELMKLFLNNNSLRINNNLMEDVKTALAVVTNENLAWSSKQVFELLTFLSSEAPDIVLNFLPKLLHLIKEVELKRGVGYDKTLRIGFEKIEQHLNVLTKRMV